ncbi:hypothetical protein [Nocardia sp. NPDC052316]|uniref:hypothetical protein n=1 Tax=Nocardia sp. NPDC052316 TaxID=3364329 RepID=UPI0037CCB93E
MMLAQHSSRDADPERAVQFSLARQWFQAFLEIRFVRDIPVNWNSPSAPTLLDDTGNARPSVPSWVAASSMVNGNPP